MKVFAQIQDLIQYQLHHRRIYRKDDGGVHLHEAIWKSRGRLPEPFQTISGTPVWDWDISEEDFRSIEKNENSGRPKKPKISIAGGLIEIDVQGSKQHLTYGQLVLQKLG